MSDQMPDFFTEVIMPQCPSCNHDGLKDVQLYGFDEISKSAIFAFTCQNCGIIIKRGISVSINSISEIKLD